MLPLWAHGLLPTSNVMLRYQLAELGKCPVLVPERDAPIGTTAKAGQDPLMPCSRAYFVNSAVLRMPSLRITFDLWNATVLREMLRIAAIS